VSFLNERVVVDFPSMIDDEVICKSFTLVTFSCQNLKSITFFFKSLPIAQILGP
jgi:hypothetical protein